MLKVYIPVGLDKVGQTTGRIILNLSSRISFFLIRRCESGVLRFFIPCQWVWGRKQILREANRPYDVVTWIAFDKTVREWLKKSLSLGRENWLAKTLGGLRLQRVPVEWLFLRSSWSLLRKKCSTWSCWLLKCILAYWLDWFDNQDTTFTNVTVWLTLTQLLTGPWHDLHWNST